MKPGNPVPVVLCGGKSSRMGKDKGLMPAGSGNWLQQSVNMFSFLPAEVLVSLRDQQLSQYQAFHPAHLFITDNPGTGIHGPVSGLITVHEKRPADDLFILACDMQQMLPQVLKILLNRYQENPGREAYLFSGGQQPEPLCGIYTASGLARISLLLREGRLEKFSMKYLLGLLNHLTIPIPEEFRQAFKNFNTLADLNDH